MSSKAGGKTYYSLYFSKELCKTPKRCREKYRYHYGTFSLPLEEAHVAALLAFLPKERIKNYGYLKEYQDTQTRELDAWEVMRLDVRHHDRDTYFRIRRKEPGLPHLCIVLSLVLGVMFLDFHAPLAAALSGCAAVGFAVHVIKRKGDVQISASGIRSGCRSITWAECGEIGLASFSQGTLELLRENPNIHCLVLYFAKEPLNPAEPIRSRKELHARTQVAALYHWEILKEILRYYPKEKIKNLELLENP